MPIKGISFYFFLISILSILLLYSKAYILLVFVLLLLIITYKKFGSKVTLLLIALAGLFLTSTANKWYLFAPVVVPMFMQSNISPQFAQIVLRAGDSITKGFTPLLASFVLYIGYLNLYNLHKEKPYTIRKSMQLIMPYFLLIASAWILIVVGWYILGLPIGPGVSPTI